MDASPPVDYFFSVSGGTQDARGRFARSHGCAEARVRDPLGSRSLSVCESPQQQPVACVVRRAFRFFRVKTCVKQSEAVIRDVRVLCESSASNFVSAVVRARSEAKAFSAAAATKVKAGGEPLKEEAEPQPAASKGEEQERDQESPLAVVPEWGPLPGDGNCLSLATRSALAEAASLFNANLRVLEHRIWRLLEERAVLDCPYRRNKLQGGRNARPLASSEERRIRQLALQAAAAAELKDKEAQKKAQKPAVVDPLLRPPPSVLRVPHCEWRAFPKLSQIKNLKNGDCQTLGLYISIQ